MTEEQFQSFLAKARHRIEGMQEVEQKYGFASEENLPIPEHLRTITFALEAGIKRKDWPCVGDAYVMLQDVLRRLKTTTILEVLMEMKHARFPY